MTSRATLVAGILAVLACSCGHRRVGRVDAISTGAPFSRSYFLVPGQKGVSQDDLVFRSISRHVHGAMQELGYRPAASMVDAGLLIMVAYGVSEPFTSQDRMTVPITNYVPGRTFTVNSTTNSTAAVYGPGGFASGSGLTTTNGTVTESGRTETTYQSFVRTTTTYVSYLELKGFDGEQLRRAAGSGAKSLDPVWRTIVLVAEPSGDLRRQIPGLLEAAQPYIGKTTPGHVNITVPDSDGSQWNVVAPPPAKPRSSVGVTETPSRPRPTASAPDSPRAASWQKYAAQYSAMKLTPGFAEDFVTSPELFACPCALSDGIGRAEEWVTRASADEDTDVMVARGRAHGATGTDFEVALSELQRESADEERTNACMQCHLEAFSKWKARSYPE